MAKHAPRAPRVAIADLAAAGQHPTVEATALCEGGRHDACKGEILSLLVPVGTPCGCTCHQPRRPAPGGR
jgi:hypothetical protein